MFHGERSDDVPDGGADGVAEGVLSYDACKVRCEQVLVDALE